MKLHQRNNEFFYFRQILFYYLEHCTLKCVYCDCIMLQAVRNNSETPRRNLSRVALRLPKIDNYGMYCSLGVNPVVRLWCVLKYKTVIFREIQHHDDLVLA